MIKAIRSIFKGEGKKNISDYAGFSDFFLRASDEEKKKVITEAAKKANEDQLKVFHNARLKAGVN